MNIKLINDLEGAQIHINGEVKSPTEFWQTFENKFEKGTLTLKFINTLPEEITDLSLPTQSKGLDENGKKINILFNFTNSTFEKGKDEENGDTIIVSNVEVITAPIEMEIKVSR